MTSASAKVEERHMLTAIRLVSAVQVLPPRKAPEYLESVAQALADAEERGQNDAWDAADTAIRGMQPNPPRTETSFECYSANAKAILDATRALYEARLRK